MLAVPQGEGIGSAGGSRSAKQVARGGATLWVSWQPTHPRRSPGIAPVNDRMVCSARCLSSKS